MVRIKHRYLLVEILYPSSFPLNQPSQASTTPKPLPDTIHFHAPTPDALTPSILIGALKTQIGYLYGDYGVGLCSNGLKVNYLSHATSTVIIRCLRENYRIVWAALTWMTALPRMGKVEGNECVFRVVRVSGTIRKCEEEVVRRGREEILRIKGEGEVGLEGLLGANDAGGMEASGGKKRGKEVVGIEDDDEEDENMDSDSGEAG